MTLRIYCIFLFLSLLPIVSLISRFLLAFLWFVVGNLACSIPGVPEIELGILPYLGQYTTPGNTFSPVYFERYLTKQDCFFFSDRIFHPTVSPLPTPPIDCSVGSTCCEVQSGKTTLKPLCNYKTDFSPSCERGVVLTSFAFKEFQPVTCSSIPGHKCLIHSILYLQISASLTHWQMIARTLLCHVTDNAELNRA